MFSDGKAAVFIQLATVAATGGSLSVFNESFGARGMF